MNIALPFTLTIILHPVASYSLLPHRQWSIFRNSILILRIILLFHPPFLPYPLPYLLKVTCTYYNLPYINQLNKGSTIATHLAPRGPHNTAFWILSINHHEFSTAEQTTRYLSSIQLSSTSTTVPFVMACRQSTDCTSLADNHAMFNQVRLSYRSTPLSDASSMPFIAPVGCEVISLPTCPTAPEHIDKLSSNPHAPD